MAEQPLILVVEDDQEIQIIVEDVLGPVDKGWQPKLYGSEA